MPADADVVAGRRKFLEGLTAALVLFPAFRTEALALSQRERAPIGRALLVDPAEPGLPLEVSGTLFAPDGRAPLPGITLRVYQTDSEGYYSRPVSDPRRARIRGAVVSDAEGRYALRTIRPGCYPSRAQAAHIHVHLEGADFPEHWIDSFFFEGDPYLRAEDLARSRALDRFRHVVAERPDAEGVLRCSRDIRLDPDVARANTLLNGWYAQ